MKLTKIVLLKLIKEETEKILKENLIGQIKNILFAQKQSLKKYYDALKSGMSKEEAQKLYLDPVVKSISNEVLNNIKNQDSFGRLEADLTAAGGTKVIKPGGMGTARIYESDI